ncbi:MAG: ribosome biogenesis GTPase Der [Gammaproteobacteria bacterium]
MLPVIALVGRPNVGKSTLFNSLTRSRDALVADQPGLTRDRQYGIGQIGPRPYLVIDTGGLSSDQDGIDALMAQQAMVAVREADVVLLLVDARAGLSSADETIAAQLRRQARQLYLVVNKTEGMDSARATLDFHSLGVEPLPISAAHGHNVAALLERVLEALPVDADVPTDAAAATEGIRVAVLGRPNVGKSTLVNRLLGEERVLTFDQPGTTRDSIFIPFERDGQAYTLIDTAGVRRRSRVDEGIEKFSVIKTLQAIEAAHVVIMVLDASEGITEQDAHLLGHALESGRALVLAVNKWDGLESDQRTLIKRELDVKLPFLDFAETHFISALHGSGVGPMFKAVQSAYSAATMKLSTPQLTRALLEAVISHQPPLVRGRRIKLRYAHQGGSNPPLIVIHGNQTEYVPKDYSRYLAKYFRELFKLAGTPVRIEYKSGSNPYEGRKNVLTPRQREKRRRLMRHAK